MVLSPLFGERKKNYGNPLFKCSVKTNPIGSLSLGISTFSGKKTDGIYIKFSNLS